MKKSILSFIVLVFWVTSGVFAGTPFGDGFAGGQVGSYLENAENLYEDATLVKSPGMTGKNCLRLTYDNEIDARFFKVPVNDSTAYALSFRGRWKNNETLESNPMYEGALFEKRRALMDGIFRRALLCVPTMDILFYDGKEKLIQDGIVMAMPYGKWREYRNVFYPPAGATSMRLKIKSSRNRGVFFVDNVKFETVKNQNGEIILNFNNGSADYSGSVFGFRVDGALHILADGRSMIDSGCGNLSNAFRLNGPGKYRLKFKGEVIRTKGYVPRLNVIFLNTKGEIIATVAADKLDAEPLDFTLPEEAVKIMLQIYNHRMEEIRIARL